MTKEIVNLTPKKRKIPDRLLYVGLSILAVLTLIVYNTQRDEKASDNFFKAKFSSIVISKLYHWSGRVKEFHLANEAIIHVPNSEKYPIEVGDSIVKNANTEKYEAYRKDVDGHYELWNTYNTKEQQE